MKMWTVQIKDQTACSVQSDLNLHCPQKLLVPSSVRKEVKYIYEHLKTLLLENHWICQGYICLVQYGVLFPPSTNFRLRLFNFSTFHLFDFSSLTFLGRKVEVLLTFDM